MKKKKYNRIGSLLMSLVLLVFFVPTASAATVPEDENTISINDLSADTISMLQELGVNLNSDSKIQLAPLGENTQGRSVSGNTLSITNVDGDEATTNTILVFDENGYVPIEKSGGNARAQRTYSFSPASKIAITATATYNRYVKDGLYYYAQPLSAGFKYTRINTSTQVQNISLQYSCSGETFTYPGYELGPYPAEHYITLNQNSPTAGYNYSKSNPFNSSLVIWLNGSDALKPGHSIYMEATVDGLKYTGFSGIYKS